ncbi:MAG: sugar phosphate isomerase/epimerase [Chloroflexi bacterium]|nr:sugar phosphate isomerase/epimerase [Chloroflexota bacterium]
MTKVSLSTSWGVGRFTHYPEFVQAAKVAGFAWIELNHQFPPEWLSSIDYSGPRIGISSLHDPCPNRTMPGTGRRASSFNLADTDEAGRATAVDIARATIDLAGGLGAEAVVIHLGTTQRRSAQEAELRRMYNEGQAESPEFAELRERLIAERARHAGPALEAARRSLHELAAHAGERGVRLGLENRQDYMEMPGIDEMGELLSEVDPAVAGFWYDVGHATLLDRLGFIPHAEWLRRYGPRMVGCHLHDVIGATDHHAPGTGDVDWTLVASGIPATALRVMEVHHSAEPEAMKAALPFLRERGIIGL